MKNSKSRPKTPIQDLMIAYCVGNIASAKHMKTIARMSKRNQERASKEGLFPRKLWRTFFRRNRNIFVESSRSTIRQMGDELSAEVASEDAMRAVSDMMEMQRQLKGNN